MRFHRRHDRCHVAPRHLAACRSRCGLERGARAVVVHRQVPDPAPHVDRVLPQLRRVVQLRAVRQYDRRPARSVRRREEDDRPVQRGAHDPGSHLHRHGARSLGSPPGVRGDPDVRRDPEHDLRPVEFVQHARAQPPRLVGGRRRIRGGHPHGVGMVPAERGRHGRRGVRRLGQLRRGGRRILAPAARRVVRWRRRVALVDPAHRHHRRRLRRVLPHRSHRHAGRCQLRASASSGCARGDQPQGRVRARGDDDPGERRARADRLAPVAGGRDQYAAVRRGARRGDGAPRRPGTHGVQGESPGAGRLVRPRGSVSVPVGRRAVDRLLRHVRFGARGRVDAAWLLRRDLGPRTAARPVSPHRASRS